MIYLYEITGEINYLEDAKKVVQQTWDLFYDKENKILQKKLGIYDIKYFDHNNKEEKLEYLLKNSSLFSKINFIEDKKIISGFIVKLGSTMIDFSMKSKLDKIINSLR